MRFAHIISMTGRPCRPGEDLKGLWRMLLPGTPFPACGLPDEQAQERSAAMQQDGVPTKATGAVEAKTD
ncbi:MAG: hypothetical protein WBD53_19950 [Xanthobacteraceae bacterium]